jgi:hypothetical protein
MPVHSHFRTGYINSCGPGNSQAQVCQAWALRISLLPCSIATDSDRPQIRGYIIAWWLKSCQIFLRQLYTILVYMIRIYQPTLNSGRVLSGLRTAKIDGIADTMIYLIVGDIQVG